jgi:hypothetical protein
MVKVNVHGGDEPVSVISVESTAGMAAELLIGCVA